VNEDALGAVALVNVVAFAQENQAERPILAYHLTNYLEGMSPSQLEISAADLKLTLQTEKQSNRGSVHLALTQNNVDAMLGRVTDFLAGHLRNKRYGRDLARTKRGPRAKVTSPASPEKDTPPTPSQAISARYSELFHLNRYESQGLHRLLLPKTRGPWTIPQQRVVHKIATRAEGTNVEWTESERATVEALLYRQMSLRRQMDALQSQGRQRSWGQMEAELITGLQKLADAIEGRSSRR
jgi:hypothetical protein